MYAHFKTNYRCTCVLIAPCMFVFVWRCCARMDGESISTTRDCGKKYSNANMHLTLHDVKFKSNKMTVVQSFCGKCMHMIDTFAAHDSGNWELARLDLSSLLSEASTQQQR